MWFVRIWRVREKTFFSREANLHTKVCSFCLNKIADHFYRSSYAYHDHKHSLKDTDVAVKEELRQKGYDGLINRRLITIPTRRLGGTSCDYMIEGTPVVRITKTTE